MTKEVVTVGPHYNVADVASLMDAKGIGSVIVLEEDRVLGILTERDILKVIGAGEDPKNVAAHEALIGDLYTITPDASIEDAASQMTQAKIRHLPVIADDQIVGIISIRDVVLIESGGDNLTLTYLVYRGSTRIGSCCASLANVGPAVSKVTSSQASPALSFTVEMGACPSCSVPFIRFVPFAGVMCPPPSRVRGAARRCAPFSASSASRRTASSARSPSAR
jgi:signal-transduction protein with cAMP-binding, CBS, and nucleotidyltransferase domain